MSDVNVNQAPVDQYTALHFAAGVAMRRAKIGLLGTVLLSLAWEHWIEPAWKRTDPKFFPAPSQDKPINSLVDTVAVAVGWAAGGTIR